jgi:hypothetical protein
VCNKSVNQSNSLCCLVPAGNLCRSMESGAKCFCIVSCHGLMMYLNTKLSRSIFPRSNFVGMFEDSLDELKTRIRQETQPMPQDPLLWATENITRLLLEGIQFSEKLRNVRTACRLHSDISSKFPLLGNRFLTRTNGLTGKRRVLCGSLRGYVTRLTEFSSVVSTVR